MTGVEAAALSAIVSVTLKTVGNKLAQLLIKEYSSIMGVKEDLQELHGFVEEINYTLEAVGHNTMGSGPSFHWLKNLKEVSYEVDDVVDTFQLESEKYETNGDGSIVSKYLHTIPKSFISQCKAANKIKAIKKRFAQIVKQRTDYLAIAKSLSVDLLVRPRIMRTVEMPLLPYVDEESVVGRNKDKQLIISKLEETDDQQKINIISVIGLGGIGKTTLAKLVFNDDDIIKKHFKFRLWVHASQEFDVEKLIMKMFEALADNNLGQHSLQYMSKTISDKLAGKRFLLVLDDVWIESQFQWEKIREFLVNVGAPGSRILLTTRNAKVAETVGSTELYKLPLLSEATSWQLFMKIYGMDSNNLASEFVNVGKEIVHKCGGVPLAIKVLACVLHGKERIDQWEAIRENNLLYVEGEEHRVSACLRLSYLNLPSNIKQCFAVFSVFPKGYRIHKEELIDLWISQDMIALVPGIDYLEDIGHMCFNSLVQMCFLQDVHEYGGRVTCVMHDLVHDLAQSILGDDFSLRPEAVTSSTKRCRYFSLTEESRNLLSKNIFEKARVMFISKCDDFAFGETLNNARHLRSIIVKYNYAASLHTAIAQVKYLRYLSISGEKIETLPEEISNVWGLQALHVTDCLCLLKLPESIGKLKKLRTLNMSGCANIMSLPDSIGDCHMISRIDLSHCKKFTYLPNSIGKNKNLRVLRLGYTAIRRLPSSITALGNLECLDLQFCHELVELPEGIGQLSRLQNLNTFVVGGDEKSAGISELANVARNNVDLFIGGIKHVMDPEDAHNALLKQKKKLQVLGLNWGTNGADEANKEIEQAVLDRLEPPSGTKKLYIGEYCGGKFARWMLKQVNRVDSLTQFPYLTKMTLWGFPNLKHLDQLEELPCLEDLILDDMPSLESISGGPFPSLKKLVMDRICRLGEVCFVMERTSSHGGKSRGFYNHSAYDLGKVKIGRHLPDRRIKRCPNLVIKLYFPYSLKHLVLHGSNNKMLQSPGQEHGYSSLSSDSSLRPSFGFSRLKILQLQVMISPSHSGHLSELLQHMMALDSSGTSSKHDGLTELTEKTSNLRSLQWLGELRSLEIMVIYIIYSSLNSLSGVMSQHQSSLQEMLIHDDNIPSEVTQLTGPLWSIEEVITNDFPGLSSVSRSMGQLQCLQEMINNGYHSLSSLPRPISHLRPPHKMVIKIGSLDSLPKSMGNLTSLQVLDIVQCNALQRLPENLGELRSLRKLSVKNLLSLNCLPQSMGQLTSLKELHIEECHTLQRFPECLGELQSLSELRIYNLPSLTCLPQSMDHLTSLQVLEIGWCDELSLLPECLGELQSLCKLVICGLPCLTCLPESMGHLTTLKQLYIMHCDKLQQLPECLGELWLLCILMIYSLPSLNCLPESMVHLTSLKLLSMVQCNELQQLPECLGGLQSLSALMSSDLPSLAFLPQSMGHLTTLKDLYITCCNGLQQLPECLGELRALSTLCICQLPSLTCLPQSMAHLTSLQVLRIKSCDALSLLPECLGELHSLRTLDIIGLLEITCLPQSICGLTSLEELKIIGCPSLKSLPEGIKGLTTLQKLWVLNNIDLQLRCMEEAWRLISHIPYISIR